MIDKFRTGLVTPLEAARHLDIPERTMQRWLSRNAAGHPMVHSVPARRGWPSVPFVALVEAYVLRSLRNLRLSPTAIRDATSKIRREFGTEYGLATRRVATDGIDIFIYYLDTDEMARASDGQMPFRAIIEDYLQYIQWDESGFAERLTLRRFDPKITEVVIDPRFAWGAPVVEPSRVRVEDVLDLWRAGEPPTTVADEYGLTVEQVEALVRVGA